jgi:tetratricopeptide (TPR) repeat protein
MKLAVLLFFTTLLYGLEFGDVAAQAEEARGANRIDEALELYIEATRLKPTWQEGWWYLATLYYEKEQYAHARDGFRSFVRLQPKSGPGLVMLGLCEYHTGEYARALDHLREGRLLGIGDNKPLDAASRYTLAILLTRFGHFEAALPLLLQFSQEGIDRPAYVEATGIAAMRVLSLPKELPPGKRDVVALAGRAVYEVGGRRAAQAKEAFARLLEKHPRTPNVHYLYGSFLLQEDTEAAVTELKKELEYSPKHLPARLQLAFEYLRRRDTTSALPYAREAVELDPKSFAARNALGRALLESGQAEEAIQHLEIGVKLAPEVAEQHFALASAYAKAGRKEDAARARAAFLKLNEKRRN